MKNDIKKRKRKYNLNLDYFETINSQEKAYMVGFIAADGCVTIDKLNRHCLSINLKATDREVLDNFKKDLEYEGRIYELPPRKRNPNPQVLIRINSKKIVTDLAKYNIVPRKTNTIKFTDNIEEEYISHYIRGYFDGDGSIGIYNNKYRIAIVCNSKIMLESIEKYLRQNCNLNFKNIYKRKSDYSLQYACQKEIPRITEYLYKDANLYLKRKREKSPSKIG